jgi:rhodanese-related sulfurtransferase
MTPSAHVTSVDPATLNRRMEEGSVTLLDIREADEFAREHIAGARSLPLSRWDSESPALSGVGAVAFCCRSGARTAMNAGRFASRFAGEILMLDGGLEAWRRQGLPVARDRRVPIDIMRQVQIAVGGMILLGVLLTLLVSPWFVLVPAMAGAGLLVAGTTGFCGMARLLAVMPWNRRWTRQSATAQVRA